MRVSHSSRLLIPLFIASFGASCFVPPPSCIERTFRPADREHFVTVSVFSGPTEDTRYATNNPFVDRFRNASVIRVHLAADGTGSLSVDTLGGRVLSCARIPAEDLAEVSRSWEEVLARFPRREPRIQAMVNRYTGRSDWRPDGPVLDLSVGTPTDANLGLMWDGRARLPEVIETPLIETLEMMCSNSRMARRNLLAHLPKEVSGRLTCR